ncbi:transporter substrate-binding domain-containing protein [Paraneptunicella aestuarii]|uniref:substrate-binding periplasmic protein n=1 Tax=Paraneptunicella aestuarii TaxID=2831148 RepID=UPI001E2C4E04|nr:transporter substrate-binding domain-containing protein [Paraneptunicella aestuarii]UAA38293.1 transporter substrate-binding domain-containing protein [Paraneptunicella aestuarii]
MYRFLFVFWFWATLFCYGAYAETLEVVTEETPPLQYMVDGELRGRSTEIVRDVLATAGLEANFKVYPWARAYNIAKNNKNTLIYSILRTQNRERHFAWIGAIGHFKLGFVHLSDRTDIKLKTFDDVKKWRLGVIREDFTQQYFIDLGFKEDENFILRGTLKELVNLMFSRKIDLFVGDLTLIHPLAKAYGFDETQLSVQFFPEDFDRDVYLAANINTDKAVVDALTKALEEVRARPEYINGFKRSLPEQDRGRLRVLDRYK